LTARLGRGIIEGVALVLPPLGWIAPWVGLAVWWLVLARICRRWDWVRSMPITVGLIIATLFADASVIVASSRMSAAGGREFAAAILWIAGFLSVTTFTVLRAPSGGRGDDEGGLGVAPEDPEPPWWPDFERDFNDYARRARRPSGGPRMPTASR
jgi:hypothetical protein